MNIILSAVTTAVVTTCFISTGVKDKAPTFDTEIVQSKAYCEVSPYLYTAPVRDTVTSNVVLTSQFFGVALGSDTVISFADLDTEPYLYTSHLENGVQTTAVVETFEKSSLTNSFVDSMGTVGFCNAVLRTYNTQYVNAFYKHPVHTPEPPFFDNPTESEYFVYGWYNGRIVFGSLFTIFVRGLKGELSSYGTADVRFVPLKQAQITTVEDITSTLPNIQVRYQYSVSDDNLNTVLTDYYIKTPSNINPYRQVEDISVLESYNVSSAFALDGKPTPTTELVSTGFLTVIISHKISANKTNEVFSEHYITTYVKDSAPEESNNVNTVGVLDCFQINPVNALGTLTTVAILYGVKGEDKTITDPEEVINSHSVCSAFRSGIAVWDNLNTVASESFISTYVLDLETDAEIIDTLLTVVQSDLRYQDALYVNRTEYLQTANIITLLYTPGLVENTETLLNTEGAITVIKGDDKGATETTDTLNSYGIASTAPFKFLDNGLNEVETNFGGVQIYAKHTEPEGTDVVSSSAILSKEIDRPVYYEDTVSSSNVLTRVFIYKVLTDLSEDIVSSTGVIEALFNPTKLVEYEQSMSTAFGLQVFHSAPIEHTDTITTTLPNIQVRVVDKTADTLLVTPTSAGYLQCYKTPEPIPETVDIVSTALGDIQTDPKNPFAITLDKRSGSGGTSTIICLNGYYLDPTEVVTPTRAGYTFNGYYTETSGGTQRINSSGIYVALTNTTYTAEVTLYAQWSTITYTLTNDRNGGTGGNNDATYNIETSSTIATLLGSPTRTGYTLANWRWTSTTAGGWTNNTDYAVSTNVNGRYATGTLQAQWTANSFVITLNANGGTAATNNEISVTYNTSIESFNIDMLPTRTGYTFNGYYTETTGGTQRISSSAYVSLNSTTYSSATTLYAQWTLVPEFPEIRSVNSGVLSTAALTLTVQMPTDHEEGDLLIIGVSLDGNRAMSAPSGWTLLANPTNHTACRHAVWYKTRGSSESNPAITWVTTTELGTWYAFVITTGTWSGTPEVATASGTNANPNAPSLTPSWGTMKTLWLALHGWDYNRSSSTNPTNYTLRTYRAGSSTGSAGHRTHSRANEVASEDPSQITISASDEWYAHTVAIKPAVPTKWTYLGTSGSYDSTVAGGSEPDACKTPEAMATWLTTNSPPGNYAFGHIRRVTHTWYDIDMNTYTCDSYFYKAE